MALLTTNRITEQTRVLSRIYHLGEKSLVAEGDKPLRGVPQIPWMRTLQRGHCEIKGRDYGYPKSGRTPPVSIHSLIRKVKNRSMGIIN